MNIKREKIKVRDMTCNSCEVRIENEIRKLDGIVFAKANFKNGEVYVEFNSKECSLEKIKAAIKKAGYSLDADTTEKILELIILILVMVLLYRMSNIFNISSALSGEVTYLILFIIGLFTSLHCIGMCGGIMLSQTLKSEGNTTYSKIVPALQYNLGRVISYTLLGGIIGALGSVFSLSPYTKAFIMVFAGLFMVVMGLNLFGFNFLRKYTNSLHIGINFKRNSNAPFIVGILNGLMPCGPLQAMQLYALSTGSFVKGALSMFVFSIGTVPLMLGLGIASTLINKNGSQRIYKYSGIFVMVLGIIMLSRGFALAGININPMKYSNSNVSNAARSEIADDVQTIRMDATYAGYTPNVFVVQRGVPVKFIINGKELTSCNNYLIIPSLRIEKQLQEGENIIEFTPENVEDINFSCWMGMLNGVIKVVDDINSVDTSNIVLPQQPGGG
ncbi:Copper-exporting P-type ATPase A [Caloramator mitchellensis]|uniref:Copper-exporting P-type ATPase A n=1 Tax=Caloramator mitchellensis TaxID=908809 RepID=A0A0R3JTA1_CALMK|nr:sulfite exporter TauE/SafE family protein [Caloramator mitchellensis]KRQ86752.1 Copper-exporting P-type ATPase A [Caloramator mitchellensis]